MDWEPDNWLFVPGDALPVFPGEVLEVLPPKAAVSVAANEPPAIPPPFVCALSYVVLPAPAPVL